MVIFGFRLVIIPGATLSDTGSPNVARTVFIFIPALGAFDFMSICGLLPRFKMSADELNGVITATLIILVMNSCFSIIFYL